MSALVRYNCSTPTTLSSWLEDFFNDGFYSHSGREITNTSWPRVDITEEENEYKIKADLPGLEKKDISISVEEGVLSIEGEKKAELEKKEKDRYYHFERSYGKFRRAFSLPEYVDEKSINANLKNGVLEVSLKKTEPPKPKKIEVKVD